MTKKQEAIERLNRFKTIEVLYSNTFAMHIEQLKTVQEDIETVLNMLKEKDKQIDLMANYIVDLIKYNNPEEKREVEEIKQYFENQNKLFKYDYNKKSTLDINSNAEI